MHPALRRLLMRWTLVAAGLALALSVATGLWGLQRADERIAVEKARTAAVIGAALAQDLAQALGQGIPIHALVGVEDWFADALKASPGVLGLSLHDAGGAPIAQAGVPAALEAPLRGRVRAGQEALAGGSVVTLAVAGGPEALPQGWLHVVLAGGHERLAPWLWSLAVLGLTVVLAALLLRLAVHRQLELPLRSLRRTLERVAAGEGVAQDLAVVASGPTAPLTRALRERLLADAAARARLLQKAAEVRAAHFDPGVLARIDAITQPWQHAAAGDAATDTARDPMRRPSRLGLAGRLGAAATLAVTGVLALTLLLSAALQEPDRRLLLRQARELLAAQLDRVRDFEGERLQIALDALAGDARVRAALEAGQVEEAGRRIADLRPEDVTVSVLGADAELLAVSPPRRARPQPDRAVLAEGGSGHDAPHDYWQGVDGGYQSGLIRTLPRRQGGPVHLVATRPIDATRIELERHLGATVQLLDLRGRAIGESTTALAAAWQAQGRQDGPARIDGVDTLLVSRPLDNHRGVPLATVLVALPRESGPGGNDRLLLLVSALGLLATLTALVLYIRRSLRPLARASSRLAGLATGDSEPGNGPGASAARAPARERLSPDTLDNSIDRLHGTLETLAAFRRARTRQGRRQARFMRHQMLQLAQRLDDSDRDAMLAELERLESASRPASALPATHPAEAAPVATLSADEEQVVDGIGVLALGFQGLLGRVGDQYEQLSRLVEELREALRVKTQFISLQRDLEIAARIQLSFVPREFDLCDEVQMLGAYRPAKEVGGDFYDLFRLGEHHLGLTIADVSGKGIPAALFMAVSRTLLRAVSQIEEDPAQRIARLNDLLAGNNSESMFVTLFYAVLDLRDGSVTYTNAGHNPPYVLRRDGRLETLPSSHCMALGILDGLPYTQERTQLAPGDTLFLFTDGVTEAFDPHGAMFGEGRLETLLGRVAAGPVADIPTAVLEAVLGFEDGGPQSDDVTCLVARYLGPRT